MEVKIPFIQTTVPLLALVGGGLAICLLHLAVSIIYSLYLSPLRNVPGPALARYTPLWELWALRKGGFHERLIRLHEQHGPVVRLAPNRYSFNGAADMKKIYGVGSGFVKSEFYHSWGDPQRDNIFSIRDEKKHAQRKRAIAQLYTMTTVVSYEQAVEKMNVVFADSLRRHTSGNTSFGLPAFCQYYAFDVIGEITMETNFGMMDNYGDKTGIIKAIGNINDYTVQMGLIPEYHNAIFGLLKTLGLPTARVLTENIIRTIEQFRKADRSADAFYESFLAKLLRLEKQGKADKWTMMDVAGANINAGSDTTGLTLSAAFYYVYSHPDKLARLRDELDRFERDGRASDPVTFAQVQDMPYLQAVIKEVLRMHPAVGVILPRTVPEGGAELGGYVFPAKTAVGCSAWPLHYNAEQIDRPREFLPERWLDSDGDAASKNNPASTSFAFGGGSRVCIGKNISLLEISKLLPQVVRNFDIHINAESEAMPTRGMWFIWPQYTCRVEERKRA
ncbi:hypothetical protein HIM_05107 [Hirsutella minnesotensis 3608]|uniref:Pisatin demethylase n=1 Tax=Hirsutella minnesotensis 3608 TaxID=1043627 RepID=A0A0F7ZKM6_9HYPO|nr:hypothetical protein HIM_05107 [Hirsutella minnesotensis 3608]